jgi:hypothetical protein
MGKRQPDILFVGTHREAGDLQEALGLPTKYLCGDCNQLRGGPPNKMPTKCGACGSTNIDIETDMASQRLEIRRVGGPEAYEELLRTGKLRDA